MPSVKVWVHSQVSEYNGSILYNVFVHDDMTSCGYVKVAGPFEIEFEIPDDAALKAAHVEVLREKQTELRGDAEQKCTAIQSVINKLLSLEYKPGDQEILDAAPHHGGKDDNDLPF